MHSQNERPNKKIDTFLNKKWVRNMSYGLAVILILLIVAVSIDRNEFPTTTGWVIIVASLVYILSDIKIEKR